MASNHSEQKPRKSRVQSREQNGADEDKFKNYLESLGITETNQNDRKRKSSKEREISDGRNEIKEKKIKTSESSKTVLDDVKELSKTQQPIKPVKEQFLNYLKQIEKKRSAPVDIQMMISNGDEKAKEMEFDSTTLQYYKQTLSNLMLNEAGTSKRVVEFTFKNLIKYLSDCSDQSFSIFSCPIMTTYMIMLYQSSYDRLIKQEASSSCSTQTEPESTSDAHFSLFSRNVSDGSIFQKMTSSIRKRGECYWEIKMFKTKDISGVPFRKRKYMMRAHYVCDASDKICKKLQDAVQMIGKMLTDLKASNQTYVKPPLDSLRPVSFVSSRTDDGFQLQELTESMQKPGEYCWEMKVFRVVDIEGVPFEDRWSCYMTRAQYVGDLRDKISVQLAIAVQDIRTIIKDLGGVESGPAS